VSVCGDGGHEGKGSGVGGQWSEARIELGML
jgi:hypothetical protein